LKPQQDKFVKDKLLNEIFQEIADENTETGETSYQEEKNIDHNKKLTKKKTIQKIRQRVIIAMLVILILFILFSPSDKTNTTNVIDGQKNMYTIPEANQVPTPEELKKAIEEAKKEKEVLVKEAPVIEISEKAMLMDVPTPNAKPLTVEKQEEKPKEKSKTDREKAKNSLMQQMQN